jgi:ribosome-binding protein aMBF1 (putative translation factor)
MDSCEWCGCETEKREKVKVETVGEFQICTSCFELYNNKEFETLEEKVNAFHKVRACFGTNEYSSKSMICKNCEENKECYEENNLRKKVFITNNKE